MLINLRNALMSGKRLPYDAEVEYLESTGTQYINTGVKFTTDNARVKFTASVDYVSDKALCGSQNHSAENNYGLMCYLYSGTMRVYAGTTNTGAISSLVDGNVHTVDLQANSGTLTKTIDGTISTANYRGTIVSGEDFTIFTSWRVAGSSMTARCVGGKIYSFQIWNNGVLVRDFIPVRRGTVGYLYDRVSGKLFGNAGTGDFVLGPDVVPVEYIESHGTEYINMGVAINTGTDTITSRFMPLTGINTYECLFGASESISGVTTYCELRKLQNTRDWYMLYPNSVGGLGNILIGTLTDSAWHDVSVSNTGCIMDGVTTSYDVSTRQFTNNQYLFARNNNGSVAFQFKGRVASYYITRSGADIRAMKSVRVGTGSTWEGAMMDVLTRRIYRNAGTGAFTFGNDLKYPIPAE